MFCRYKFLIVGEKRLILVYKWEHKYLTAGLHAPDRRAFLEMIVNKTEKFLPLLLESGTVKYCRISIQWDKMFYIQNSFEAERRAGLMLYIAGSRSQKL